MTESNLKITFTDPNNGTEWSYNRLFLSLEVFLEENKDRFDSIYGANWSVTIAQ